MNGLFETQLARGVDDYNLNPVALTPEVRQLNKRFCFLVNLKKIGRLIALQDFCFLSTFQFFIPIDLTLFYSAVI